jgi:trimeric autotransporter adhesin
MTPTISSISPGSIVAGSPSQTVTFTGTGYVASTAAALNGTALQAKYVSATSLQVAVPASALASGQIVSFVASNPSPGGGNSAAASFSIMSPTPILPGFRHRRYLKVLQQQLRLTAAAARQTP